MWNYIGGSKRLPIQWSAWLAHTRAHPPSVEELQIDLIRQQRVQHNAVLIEARFQQERTQLIQEASPPPSDGPSSQAEQPSVDPSSPVSPPPESLPTTEGFTPNTPVAQRPGSTLPKTGSDEYQPETWTPKARVRRG
ncbi:hypothetical protein BDP27DRAFT_1310104 [Rhodocollybia butyracea]|uniref:NADH dehydrogenase [ubiquinone] 1 alpha subcomplex subunit 12 n=1 Tax=Rhodocollybia butyracea TaxID=206335 RepID=A0A9P5QBF2_9AGAR|nr:hypothetical protein BDP27DRAFT_1310104 [Rhodocollybia butyracea]